MVDILFIQNIIPINFLYNAIIKLNLIFLQFVLIFLQFFFMKSWHKNIIVISKGYLYKNCKGGAKPIPILWGGSWIWPPGIDKDVLVSSVNR
jgi:hypothetical protein